MLFNQPCRFDLHHRISNRLKSQLGPWVFNSTLKKRRSKTGTNVTQRKKYLLGNLSTPSRFDSTLYVVDFNAVTDNQDYSSTLLVCF